MSNFAILEDKIVKDVVNIDKDIVNDFYPNKNFVEIKENRLAAIGMEYDESDEYFYWPRKFASWTKKEGNWIPPKPYPYEEYKGEPWRDIDQNLIISEEKFQGLSFNSAGRPIEFTWQWNEESLDWEKKFIKNNEEQTGRFTSDTYAE